MPKSRSAAMTDGSRKPAYLTSKLEKTDADH